MSIIFLLLRWVVTFIVAILFGKILARFKMPSIIGWLLAGIVMGPYAIGIMNEGVMYAPIYQRIISILETAVGITIGSELIWKKIKQFGRSIITITVAESLGTFIIVSGAFAILFTFQDIPLYLALIFGGIALATAPVPALSIIREYNTKGPVSSALIMIAALDDLAATVIFFSLMAVIAGTILSSGTSLMIIPIVLFVPILIGAIVGWMASIVFNRIKSSKKILITLILFILATTLIGNILNELMTKPLLNYLLMGMSFSAVFSNLIPEKKLDQLLIDFTPYLNVSFILFIINLGAPLNYRLIFGAGLYTFVYIIFRGLGKYFGTYTGALLSEAQPTVRKYLGFTLLPHSGVSLVFTSIASSFLMPSAPELAAILGGTIAAAAIINEVIAVIISKKAFVWAGELKG